MTELISIKQNQNGTQAVSARELYNFLEVESNFTTWAKRMFEYGFTDNVDYSICFPFQESKEKGRGGHNAIDYVLTIDCAKEISMIQRSEKGKQARLYFIECEKKLKNLVQLPNFLDPAESAIAWAEQYKGRVLAEARAEENEEDAMKYRDFINKIDCILIGDYCKIIGVKPNKFRAWLRDKNYLMSGANLNKPYQYHTDLFEVVYPECTDGKVRQVTVLNKKGVNYFTKKKIKGVFDELSK